MHYWPVTNIELREHIGERKDPDNIFSQVSDKAAGKLVYKNENE